MSKLRVYGMITLSAAFLLLFLTLNQRPVSLYRDDTHLDTGDLTNDKFLITKYSAPKSIEDAIKHARQLISDETFDYIFPFNTSLSNFTPSTNGVPFRTLILTTWRSGSTFLGEILNAVPGNFYHYEPLLDYGIIQIRGPPYEESAVRNLKRLLNCDYSDMNDYLGFGQTHTYLFSHNTRLWDMCEQFPAYCWNATFLSRFCMEFPFQSMKIVRLRLRLAETLLKDKSLNVNIVLLVRDPRAILQSRKHRQWCPGYPDCDQPNWLCDDMVSDYNSAVKLLQHYPTRFRVIRYEDLSLNTYTHTKNLFNFLGLYFHPNVKNFLDTHTKQHSGGVSSTFRNSKTAPFHWRTELHYSEVEHIQEYCDQAMRLWGYHRAYNASHLKEFDPLGDYELEQRQ